MFRPRTFQGGYLQERKQIAIRLVIFYAVVIAIFLSMDLRLNVKVDKTIPIATYTNQGVVAGGIRIEGTITRTVIIFNGDTIDFRGTIIPEGEPVNPYSFAEIEFEYNNFDRSNKRFTISRMSYPRSDIGSIVLYDPSFNDFEISIAGKRYVSYNS
ncbi:MAG: hypothetical protein LBN43_07895 [Oscillospiraceae bacterium]|jgi:hypothetical protein|nr:hypothetical protein [Oscillospiraceae bacterium]